MPSPLLPRFEPFEHTADAGIVAYGRSLAETFEQAARGMYALMVDLETVRERESVEIAVEAGSVEALLVAWLSELLYLTDVRGLLFRSFQMGEATERRATGRARGEAVDRERHALGVAVKAVTRHLLEVTPIEGGYRARVLFDI